MDIQEAYRIIGDCRICEARVYDSQLLYAAWETILRFEALILSLEYRYGISN